MKNKRGLKKYLAGILSTALIFSLVLQAGMAYAEDQGATELGLTIMDGDLTITVPTPVALKENGEDPFASGDPVDVSGIIGEGEEKITITDLRGSGAGWDVSVDITHLGIVNPETVLIVEGENFGPADISITGRYDGRNPVPEYGEGDGMVHSGNIAVKITAISDGAPTEVAITSPGGAVTETETVVDDEASAFGLTFEFTGGTYAVDDEFKVPVDHQSYIQVNLDYVEDSLETAGSTAGIHTENVIFTHEDETEIRGLGDENVVKADPGYGTGATKLENELTWTIHANPLMGNYQAILTYTVTG